MNIFFALPSSASEVDPDGVAEIFGSIASGREFPLSPTEQEALALAREQLAAYNSCDLEAFLLPFAEDVEIYTFPDQLRYSGKENMREVYGRMFAANPDLNCEITQEIVFNNYVVHREYITGRGEGASFHALCIYVVEKGKIARAYFF